MSALTFLDMTPKFITFTMIVTITDEELFLAFETMFTFVGLWYGQKKFGYPALLLLLALCTKLYYVFLITLVTLFQSALNS
jgi:hypothetical protein